jgi:hypothetical protein
VDQQTKPVTPDDGRDAAPISYHCYSDMPTAQPDGKQVVPIWCPVANMTSERPYGPGGQITKRGSKHFAAGAKLYFRQVMNRDGDPQLEVVGRHRGSHRYVTMIVSLSWLENWRPELVYSPYVARQLYPIWKTGTLGSKLEAEFYVRKFVNREF